MCIREKLQCLLYVEADSKLRFLDLFLLNLCRANEIITDPCAPIDVDNTDQLMSKQDKGVFSSYFSRLVFDNIR